MIVEFEPNFVCESYHFLMGEGNILEEQDIPLEQILDEQGVEKSDNCTYIWSDLTPETTYNIYVLPENFEGTHGEIEKMSVKTLAVAGPSVIELEVEVMSETQVYTKATPNEFTGEYHYGLFFKDEYEELEESEIIDILFSDEFPLYDEDEWLWDELPPLTDYYAVAVGMNTDDVMGELTVVPFRTEMESCVELENIKFEITPNPAKSTVNINMNGSAQISIFDMTGRCVKQVAINGHSTIDIDDLDKGVYLVDVNGRVERLVIE